jgi:putative ATPase
MSLFADVDQPETVQGGDDKGVTKPLPEMLRPKVLNEIAGQDHLVGSEGALTRIIESGDLPSMILWGPPGTGKTTIARILADHTDYHFEQISAIFSGVKDLRQVFDSAKIRQKNGRGTVLFVDEIHRFNKSQLDAFLPVVENGTITLIGATTENPSFELNSALLSRCQVMVLKRLDTNAMKALLARAEEHLGRALPVTDDVRSMLSTMADGDGRYLLSMTERLYAAHKDGEEVFDEKSVAALLQKRAPVYDKNDDAHYNLISALHKSVRGSDVDAALYWFARMLSGGEDPLYIARRLVRMAVEDIGLADPQAMQVTLSAWDTYKRLGSPEGELALAQALIYLATAPKSNAAYSAYKMAVRAAKETGSYTPPAHILNAPTDLMKDLGYGAGYKYDHDQENAFSGQSYFPEEMDRVQFYDPPERGFERDINKRLAYWKKLRDSA